MTIEGAGTDILDGETKLGVTGMAAVYWPSIGTGMALWEIGELLEFNLVL